jgi:hypothetical protein
MKAVLKGYSSPDVDALPDYAPENKKSFGFLLQLFVGPDDADGYEAFDVVVCTPKWLADTHGKDEVVIGRHYLIVFAYNFERIMEEIEAFLDTCTGATWHEVALKVGRLGYWEFEDYEG